MLPSKSDRVIQAAIILGQSTDVNENTIWDFYGNPMLNTTQVYDVVFPDGIAQQYSAVIIVHSVFDLSDEDGHRYQLLEDVIGYGKTASAVD